MSTTLLLIRHGENPANVTHEFSHRKVDYGLNDKGRVQAEQTAAFLKARKLAAVWASPLKRAVETGEPIATVHGLTVQQADDLREVNVGELEGYSTPENWALHDEIVLDWFRGKPERAFPGGENYHQLLERFRNRLKMIVYAHPDATVVIVGHGGLFSFTMKDLTSNFDPQILRERRSQNCSITTLRAELRNDRLLAEVVEWANAAHLSGEAAEFVPGTPRNKWDELE